MLHFSVNNFFFEIKLKYCISFLKIEEYNNIILSTLRNIILSTQYTNNGEIYAVNTNVAVGPFLS